MKIFSSIASKFKKKSTKIAAMSVIVLSLFAGLFATSGASSIAIDSPTPRFNFQTNDYEMLQSSNLTEHQIDWTDPTSADAGDEVALSFYFHNGVPDTTAHNVTLRAQLPTGASTQHHVLSFLKSDETSTITDTVANGTIKGFGNGFAEINTPQETTLEYIPGSTQIRRTNPAQDGVFLSDGITSASGLNIGSIQGCFQYSGFVTFRVKVKSNALLSMAKYVAYPGSVSWTKEITGAKEGETVAWKVRVRNDGMTDATNVLVKDVLPDHVTYIPNTTVFFGPDTPVNGFTMADGIVGNGMIVDRIKPGEANTISLVFQTKIGTELPFDANGIFLAINRAFVTYDSHTLNDIAKVSVNGVPGITIAKTVKDADGNWVERNFANLGDVVTYRIIVKNVGDSTLRNVMVNDVIPIYTQYINGSTKVDGVQAPDGIAGAGITLSDLISNATHAIIFSVKTTGCPPIGDYTITNTAYVSTTGLTGISDTAQTVLHLNPILKPVL